MDKTYLIKTADNRYFTGYGKYSKKQKHAMRFDVCEDSYQEDINIIEAHKFEGDYIVLLNRRFAKPPKEAWITFDCRGFGFRPMWADTSKPQSQSNKDEFKQIKYNIAE